VAVDETKMRTAPPRPRNNAFGQRSHLVRSPGGYVRLLAELNADLPTKLFANANRVRLAAGKILFRAGAPGDGCYRVEDGLLKVTMVWSSGAERILAFLGRGAIVGELSIIDGLPRSATVAAVRDVAQQVRCCAAAILQCCSMCVTDQDGCSSPAPIL
jgi:CRP/FNR family transcriptional regulator, cyclic AMP receptor protein